MKQILVPCDFSKTAIEAFKMAVGIAEKLKGNIIVLYAIPIPTTYDPNFIGDPSMYNPQFFATMEDDAKKAFEEMQKHHGKNQKTKLEITVGGLFESITRVTEGNKIDLIVMGTSGSSGIQEILIGSNTEKVVRFSKVPVLAVHNASEINSIKNILVPTTGNLDESHFISKLKDLQVFLKANLHILLINTPVNFMRDAEGREVLEEFAKQYQLKDYELHFKSYKQEEEGIIDFAISNKMDLIAMATHSRKGLAHLFTGSVTENVVNHVLTPVWTYSISK